MTAADTLLKLEAVTSRGPGKWSAKCPAHADKRPSLSITEKDDRLLLHCWAGCPIQSIVQAMSLDLSDLFTDHSHPRGQRPPRRPARLDRDALAYRLDLAALDRRLRAGRTLAAATGLNGDTLTESHRDRLMDVIGGAHQSLDYAIVLEDIADALRLRSYVARKEQRHVA